MSTSIVSLNWRRGPPLLGALFAFVLLAVPMVPNVAFAQGFHGISFAKNCHGTTERGDDYHCTYRITNSEDTGVDPNGGIADADTVTFDAIEDCIDTSGDSVFCNAGDEISGNILPFLTFTASNLIGGTLPSCTANNALCTLPPGGRLTSNTYSFYTTQAGDPTPLRDQATLTWQDTCDSGADNCTPNQDGMQQAPSQTSLVDAKIAITPDETNEVGTDHIFTVTVMEDLGDGSGFVAASGELVDVTYVESGGAEAQADDQCTTLGDGTCTVTINSATAGTIVATATSAVGVGSLTLTRTTDGIDPNSGPATKLYVDAKIAITPDETNEVGTDHIFTVTVMENIGAGFVAASGELVDVTYVDSNGAEAQADAQCTTLGDGTCTVTINSATSGQIVATATSAVDVEGLSLTRTTDGSGDNSGPATKLYVDAKIAITPDETNEAGTDHIFTVTVMEDSGDGSGFVAASGELVDVTYVDSNGAEAQADAQCTTLGDGTCTVTINSATAGQIVATATSAVDVEGLSLTRTTDGSGDNSGPATKLYVDAKIAITPDETNEVGTDHIFTVTVMEDSGDGSGFVAASGELVDVTYVDSNGAEAQADAQCTTLGDGTCTVTINSATSGQIVATATSAVDVEGLSLTRTTDGIGDNSGPATKLYVDAKIAITPDETNEAGTDHIFTVTVMEDSGDGSGFVAASGELVDVTYVDSNGAEAQADAQCTTLGDGTCTVTINSATAGQIVATATSAVDVEGLSLTRTTDGIGDNSGPATKLYVDAKIAITPDETNEVGTDHIFTVTVMEDSGDGSGFVAASGELVDVTYVDSNGAEAQADAQCTTLGDGTCTVTINSATAGQIVATATSAVDVEGLSLTRTTDGIGDNSGPATKIYVDAKIAITPDETNEVGTDHIFTVTVMEDSGDGSGFVAASGELVDVTYVDSNGAEAQADAQCTTLGDGTCTVTINSATSGQIVATATSAVDVEGLSLTRTTDGIGDNSGPATKLYVDAKIAITPDETNEAGTDHIFTVTVMEDSGDGSGFVAASGELVDVTYVDSNGAEAQADAQCTTLGDGTCTVTINSATAGQIVATATSAVDVEGLSLTRTTDGIGDNSGPATKIYVDAFITINPDGTNPVGDPHIFTVTLWKDLGDGAGWVPAADEHVDFTLIDTDGAIHVLDLVASTCDELGDNTDGNGQCTIEFTSNSAGTTTGHAWSTLIVGGVSLDRATDGNSPNSDDAVKDWTSGLCLVVIDEEGVDNDFRFLEWAAAEIGDGWTPGELINDEENVFWDDVPSEDYNRLFPWNYLVDAGLVDPGSPIDTPPGGDLVLFPTGEVDDEGWYNLPDEIHYADGHADPHCGATSHAEWFELFREGSLPQECLDKIKDVMPMRNQDLAQLVGKTCIAVVYDSDISINYEPLYGNLQGERYGLFHFKVEALEVAGSIPENKSDTSFYGLWLRVLGIPGPGGEPLDFVEVRDHEPDAIEINRARCRRGTLDVRGESDFAPTAIMTVSVDGPDDGIDWTVDPILLEEPMDYIGRGRYQLRGPVDCDDYRRQRLSIQTDEGGAYNGKIR